MNIYHKLVLENQYDSYKRSELIREFSFATPTKEVLKKIVKYSPIIEIGAGSGYWAFLIENYGGKIVAFDNNARDNAFLEHEKKKYYTSKHFEVKFGDENEIKNYPEYTLFLCWIEYLAPYGLNALKLYKGKYFIYIGELEGGCCANDNFFRYLKRYFKKIQEIDIPQWFGIHDFFRIYERREEIE